MADRIVVMSNGRIEQIGTPEEIYRAPATRFVAEFIGTNNIVEGSIVDMESESVSVEATGLMLKATGRGARTGFRSGDRVAAVISADCIDIGPPVDGSSNSITATLVSEAFVGSVVTLLVETSAGEFRVQTRQRDLPDVALKPGSQLSLHWSSEDVFLLPGTAA